jgi:hypothetical protein
MALGEVVDHLERKKKLEQLANEEHGRDFNDWTVVSFYLD